VTTGNGADEATLERSIAAPEPVDPATAEVMLREAKQIMDRHGVVVFLRQGTCLGAVREQRIIPWDDDLDLGSVIGLHGLTEEAIGPVVDSFRGVGYFVKVDHWDQSISVYMVRSSIRLDWACYRVIDGSIFHFPGIRFPVRLFTELKEIDFIGEKFLVPNPPEEYLRLKYGPEWMTPKEIGYEKDVVQMAPEALIPGRGNKLMQFLVNNVLQWRAGKLRVLDLEGKPVSGAEVMVAGVGRYRTNKKGYAKFYLPSREWYAVVISYGDVEEVLYEEKMAPGGTYVYRPGSSTASLRHCVLSPE
tara:strand:- start:285 stop:1193 length:909 start_codon:yes stop_codon:yes gene_type:complete